MYIEAQRTSVMLLRKPELRGTYKYINETVEERFME